MRERLKKMQLDVIKRNLANETETFHARNSRHEKRKVPADTTLFNRRSKIHEREKKTCGRDIHAHDAHLKSCIIAGLFVVFKRAVE